MDAHCEKVWAEFEKFIQFYEVTRDFFYGTLLTVLEEGYQVDQRFHQRGEALGLDKEIYLAIDSLFRPGSLKYADGQSKLNLANTLVQLQDMRFKTMESEPYPPQPAEGNPLFPKGESPHFSDL